MKKMKWLLVVVCVLLVGAVQAASNDTRVRIDYWNDVYGNFLIGQEYYWNQMGITYANGKLAYCLEPGKWITESTYDSYTDFNIKNITDNLKQKLELIAYYGYEYKGHQTQNYYLATQELIWRELGIKEMYWSTGAVHGGSRINVDYEINTIRSLIDSHYNVPSFHNKTYQLRSGEQLQLEDTNGVFHNYDVQSPSPHATTLAGNSLIITAEQVGDTSISFIRNPDAYRVSLLYTKNDSQAIATFGLSNRLIAKVNIKVTGYSLELHKKDYDNKNEISSGEGSLKGAVYQVTDNLMFLKTMETDENGYAIMKDMPAGKYEVKEIVASPGYELDPKTYTVRVGMDTSLKVGLDVYEKVIKNEVEFIKVISNGATGIMEPESNVTFGIYTKDNQLIQEVTTDDNGVARATLAYGSYIVRQLSTTANYEKVEDFEINVDEKKKEVIRYVMNDAPVQAKLKLMKKDENGNPIKQAGIKFRIRNINTGEYVKQKLEYPEEKIIDEFITNEQGEVITPYPLEAGNYEIEEVNPPEGYLLSENRPVFQLDENTIVDKTENGNVMPIPIINKRPKGQITLQKYGIKMQLQQNEEGLYDQIRTEEMLDGVKFELTAGADIKENNILIYYAGQVIETFTTEDGMLKTPLLPLGTYCMKEIESLPGYTIDKDPQCVTLEYQDAYTPLIVKNMRFENKKDDSKIVIRKYGEEMIEIKDGKGVYKKIPLSNVTFSVVADEDIVDGEIKISKNTILYDRVTNEEGYIILEKLPLGKYRLHEKKVPDGYHKTEDVKFQVTAETKVEKIEVMNDMKKGSITVMKVDSDRNTPLDGAIFKLYNKDKKVLIDNIAATKGILKLENIAFGNYYLEEIKAPDGYIKEQVEKEIQIKKEMTQPILFKNQKSILPNTSSINQFLFLLGGILVSVCIIIFLVSFLLKKYAGK